MKELNLNETLRYFSSGVFLTILLYFSIDEKIIKDQFESFGNGDIFGIFIFICFTIGTLIYVINRASIYPLIFNPIVNSFFYEKIKTKLPDNQKSFCSFITYLDIQRRSNSDESIKKELAEWAGQVHFLYNISFTFVIIWIVSFINKNVSPIKNWLYYFLITLIIAIIHHIRYKNRELKILIK